MLKAACLVKTFQFICQILISYRKSGKTAGDSFYYQVVKSQGASSRTSVDCLYSPLWQESPSVLYGRALACVESASKFKLKSHLWPTTDDSWLSFHRSRTNKF